MPYIERPDASIWYEDCGSQDGACVLLIHGGLLEPMDGERFWIAPGVDDGLVAAGYRCLIPDRRYCAGRTSADFTSYSFLNDAKDLVAVLDAEGIDQAHVVAGSNGCSAALVMAAQVSTSLASLTLCWPATQDNALYEAASQRSTSALQQLGISAYLALLRANGLPRPYEECPDWPFGAALLHDKRTTELFMAVGAESAARVFETTVRSILSGEVLRGVWHRDVSRIVNARIPVFIVPPEPEDAFHDRTTAEMLVDAIDGARLLDGAPVTPSPHFPTYRASFIATLSIAFRSARESTKL